MTTARQLIRDGVCTPACLAATSEPVKCRCPCSGRWHALAADVDLTTVADVRQWRRFDRMTDLEILACQ